MYKQSPKVSIIVPVYNTSKYLKQCIESLVNQTLKDIEIICIDDGSTDNSVQIVKEFAQNDERIKIITQKNAGQSVARNSGLKIAQGEYIGFVDSDDWVDIEMFEKLYNNAKSYDTDIVMCSMTVYDEITSTSTMTDPYTSLAIFPEYFNNRSFDYKEISNFIFRISASACDKLYRREFLSSKGLFFEKGLIAEDALFNLQTLIESEKMSLIRTPLYYYRIASETSCMYSKDEYKKLSFFKAFRLQEKKLKEEDLYKELKDSFQFHKKNNLLHWYQQLKDKKIKRKYYLKLLKEFPLLPFESIINPIKLKIKAIQLKKTLKNKKIVFWGASLFLEEFLQKNNVKSKKILGIIDKNVGKQGEKIGGYEIFSPASINNLQPEIIIFSATNYFGDDRIILNELTNIDFKGSIDTKFFR